jgi:hypothetical protein
MPGSVASGTRCIRTQPVLRCKYSPLRLYKTNVLMVYKAEVADSSESHTCTVITMQNF